MNNWNAYKIFKNGKRAKSPFKTFKADSKDFFFSDVLPTLSEKLQNTDWLVLSTEEPQDRPIEMKENKENSHVQIRNSILSKIATRKFPSVADKNVITCLMMNEETEWKWTWCVAEGGTHKFLGELSDKFKTRKEALEWIEELIGNRHTELGTSSG